MARSLEWTSPCEQGKKLKELFHEIYQNSNSKTVLTKEGRFLNLLANSFSYFILVFVTFDITLWGDVCYKVVILSSTRK